MTGRAQRAEALADAPRSLAARCSVGGDARAVMITLVEERRALPATVPTLAAPEGVGS